MLIDTDISTYCMKIFKKIYHALHKKITTQKQPINTSQAPSKHDKVDTSYRQPITNRLIQWLENKQWQYQHRPPAGDIRVHHLIVGFTDSEADWTCVLRIHESTQLICMFGIVEEVIPQSQYVPVLMAIAKANTAIGFGGVELDLEDGELRVKLSVDAEFTAISDDALNHYLNVLANLTYIAKDIAQKALNGELTDGYDDGHDECVGGDVAFIPTKVYQ